MTGVSIESQAIPETPASPLLIARLLAEGAREMRATRFAGVAYGLVFVLMGYAIATIYQHVWQMTMGLSAGFFLMGPFVCCGIYDLSRQRENGDTLSLIRSVSCWLRNWKAIAFFAAILTFLMIVWARVSVVLFALLAAHDYPELNDMIQKILSFENMPFLLVWACVGFVFSGIVFAISVVSMPMMLDRGSDTIEAIATSAITLWKHRGAMLAWAIVITVLIGASLMFFLPALAITAPLVGHTTWRVYKTFVPVDSYFSGAD
jgi:uncharacterized membrane protein